MSTNRNLRRLAVLTLVLFAAPVFAQDSATELARAPEPWERAEAGQVIDVAIALDTSGSMKSLTEAARLKLWEIVQEITLIEPTPSLRVALLSYGRRDQPRSGWLRIETDLTHDLDRVSERLFALDSEGGKEFVTRVLKTAIDELSWSESPDALKLIFIAGNESADQDPETDLYEISGKARDAGFLVQGIFCGHQQHEQAETWKRLAELTEGQFAAIDHRTGTVVVKSPVDAELARLSAAINDTFLPIGEQGAARLESALRQDGNAGKLSPAVAASRALVKASPLYSAEWDLIDALAAGTVDLYALEDSELPEVLRGMSTSELELYIDDMRLKREELRRQIAELGDQRRQHVSQQMKKRNLDDSRAFDSAVRSTLRQKLAEKGYTAPQR